MKNTVKKQLFKTISNFYTGETLDNRLKHLVQLTKKLEKPHTGPFFGLSSPNPQRWMLSEFCQLQEITWPLLDQKPQNRSFPKRVLLCQF